VNTDVTSTNAIDLVTEIPGPRSRSLGEERRRWVSKGITEPRHGVFFERGQGARLHDVDGNVFLDLAGGIGCLNAGHSAPRVVQAARAQLERLQHSCFMVASYEPYVALARKLCEIAPITGACKAALFNSGAEAVENAIKVARRATGRPAVLAFDPGFHGRTLLALSLTSKAAPYKDGFGPFAPEVYRTPVPRDGDGIAELHRFLKANVSLGQVACAVIEPVLGEGGFIVPPPAFLLELRRLCREAGTLLVADEVQTGFGRTGRMFASEHLDLDPDLLVLAKSLSNGFPLGAVVGRAALMDAVPAGGLGGTFGGNPVACAAALAAIATIEEDGLVERARALGARAAARFADFKQRFSFIREARGMGAMQAIELDEAGPGRAARVVDQAAKDGVLVLTAGLHGNVIRTLMPLVMTDAELDEALDVLEAALATS
jgi:4-aminobutyrate aminotransferase / (S)-3-amino-2-methylpropionate transaminase / 5-aminovalerate transaminase